MRRDKGLDYLLELDGSVFGEPGGYWQKIEACLTDVTPERPHGIRYSLTLHDKNGKRIFGIDNAHLPKSKRKGYKGRIIEFDHMHSDSKDKGTPYTFQSAEQLVMDFFKHVNEIVEGES